MAIVASSNGYVQLSCDFSDPLLCTYVCEGALEPNEIKSRFNRLSVRKCHRSAPLHSAVRELLR